MSQWNRTLAETVHRDGLLIFVHKIQAPRTASWKVELRFPARLEDRVASGDKGMCEPEVFAGRSAMKPLASAGLPSGLAKTVAILAKEATTREHTRAVQCGKPPMHGTRVEYYAAHGHRLTPAQAAEADRMALIIRNPFIPETALAEMTAKLASSTVPRDKHTEMVAKLEADLAECQRTLDKNAKESKTEQNERDKERDEFREDLTILTDLFDRVAQRDLFGAYGEDDIAKAVDLLEPAMDALQEYF